MNRRLRYTSLASVLAILSAIFALGTFRDRRIPDEWTTAQRLPEIEPRYVDTTIPPNIAPLNFLVKEPGTEYRVRLHGTDGTTIDVASGSPSIVIPVPQWKRLLDRNRGGPIGIDVYVKGHGRRWQRFDTIDNTVAAEEIDSHLVYRLLGAVFTDWGRLGIYQRNLENFDELPILRNSSVERACVNCHTFADGNRPERFSFHVRPSSQARFEGGMIGVYDGNAFRIRAGAGTAATLPTYTSWHPRGALAAFSLGHMGQFMHGAGIEVREVFDFKLDLAVMNVKTGVISSTDGISDAGRNETFPAWSADGKHLYFCSAPVLAKDTSTPPYRDYNKVKYDLMRISYDYDTDTWGQPEPVLTADETGQSISEPRVSPDGRFILFCMSPHGAFSVLQSGSDLYLSHLHKNGKADYRSLHTANSPQAESWHSWSSNSRWIVFSSKRDNGLFARPYICYIDREGKDHEPFLLPQKDPSFYDTCLKTYNIPELVRGPVTVREDALAHAIRSTAVDSVSGATHLP